jgi:hypothetical protein
VGSSKQKPAKPIFVWSEGAMRPSGALFIAALPLNEFDFDYLTLTLTLRRLHT